MGSIPIVIFFFFFLFFFIQVYLDQFKSFDQSFFFIFEQNLTLYSLKSMIWVIIKILMINFNDEITQSIKLKKSYDIYLYFFL